MESPGRKHSSSWRLSGQTRYGNLPLNFPVSITGGESGQWMGTLPCHFPLIATISFLWLCRQILTQIQLPHLGWIQRVAEGKHSLEEAAAVWGYLLPSHCSSSSERGRVSACTAKEGKRHFWSCALATLPPAWEEEGRQSDESGPSLLLPSLPW